MSRSGADPALALVFNDARGADRGQGSSGGLGKVRVRWSLMEFVGVRERCKAVIPDFLSLLLSHKVDKTPSHSHVFQSVPAGQGSGRPQ